jgi:hypothetical protein
MSVKRKVRVPVGGLATALLSSLLPLRRHYSSGTYCLGPLFAQVPGGVFAVFAERDYPLRTNLCERVTDGARTRALL